MYAVSYRRFGAAAEVLKYEDIPTPVPGHGEVRVRIYASGINPSDVKNRAGIVAREMPFPMIVPHGDGAGVIDSVGAGVNETRVGERVWIWNGQFRRAFGTCAEFITLPSQQAVSLPANVSFREGACIGIPALTAHRAVSFGQDIAGKTVLISGGGGAVGHYAVQFAKLKGATVIATASPGARAEHARLAGADHVLDYRLEKLSDAVLELTNGQGVDRVVEVEFGTNLPKIVTMVRPEGVVFVYGSAGEMQPKVNIQTLMMRGITMHFRSVYLMPWSDRQPAIADLTALMQQSRVTHAIGSVLPWEGVVAAHEAVESGSVVGNVVVDVVPSAAPHNDATE